MDTQPPVGAFNGHEQDPAKVDYFYDVYDALAVMPELVEPSAAHSQIKQYVEAVSPRFYDNAKYCAHELRCKCGAKLSFPGKKLEHAAPSTAQIFVTEAEHTKSIVLQLAQMGATKYDQAFVNYMLTQPDTTNEAMLTIQLAQKNHQSLKDVATIPVNDQQKSMFLEYVVAMIEHNAHNDIAKV